jgi:uncharacterized protein (TIGR00661 family)
MKIFYAIQATGNGHISRAMEILPYLQQYGQVDLFLSGANSSLSLDAPVAYRSKGCSLFYNKSGSLDYWKIINRFAPLRIMKEVKDLPVEKYDLILNDFESITSLACAYKKIPSVHFGHQASFASAHVPLPAKKDFIGQWILQNYARAGKQIGLHFQAYDSFILPPVIKKEVTSAHPSQKHHITIYLPAYSDSKLLPFLFKIKHFRFEIFSKQVKQIEIQRNVTLIPVNKLAFNKSLINCYGIITNAGFETPAEAMYLNKKLMVIPIKGQYEQSCNAAALHDLGITVLKEINESFVLEFCRWINNKKEAGIKYTHTTGEIVNTVMQMATERQAFHPSAYSELIFN